MTQTAHVVDGIVREILVAPEGLTLDAIYPAAMLAACVQVGDDVRSGWITADGGKTFAPPPAVAAPVPGPRTVPGPALVHVLDKATKVCARDLAYVAGLNAAREDMASIVRIAGVDGSTPKAWFDAALAS